MCCKVYVTRCYIFCSVKTVSNVILGQHTKLQRKKATVLVALVLLSLGKPLMVVWSLDPVTIEKHQHSRQNHQEGKKEPNHQSHLTFGETNRRNVSSVFHILDIIFWLGLFVYLNMVLKPWFPGTTDGKQKIWHHTHFGCHIVANVWLLLRLLFRTLTFGDRTTQKDYRTLERIQ